MDELPAAKKFLRDICDNNEASSLPVVEVPGNLIEIDFDSISESQHLNIGQVGWSRVGACEALAVHAHQLHSVHGCGHRMVCVHSVPIQ